MKIGIIGLGWLGKPLAKLLMEKGHQVCGSTTSLTKCEQLQKEEGVDSAFLKLSPYPEGKDFNRLFDVDLLVINVPPKRRWQGDSFHPEQVKFLKGLMQRGSVKQVIYISATSVYPDVNRIVDESEGLNKENCPNLALYDGEQLLWKDREYDLTVIRFGGLMGEERIPGKYFSGKEGVCGDVPVNYIHQIDAVRMIEYIIDKGLWNETFNGVSPLHPEKGAVYEKNAKSLGIAPPSSYAERGKHTWKQVSSAKILSKGFTFVYNDPLMFDYTGF
ncbi:SDR family oxidoreductase [Echinicola sediminis]